MGYPIMFYITEENREKLKKVNNRSELVNNLLSKYFKDTDIKSMSLEQLEKELAKAEIQYAAQQKIKELENNAK